MTHDYSKLWKKGDVREGCITEAQINKGDHHATIVVWRENRDEAITIRDYIVDVLNSLEAGLIDGEQVEDDRELPGAWTRSDFEGGAPDVSRGPDWKPDTDNGEGWVPEVIDWIDPLKLTPANDTEVLCCCDDDVFLATFRMNDDGGFWFETYKSGGVEVHYWANKPAPKYKPETPEQKAERELTEYLAAHTPMDSKHCRVASEAFVQWLKSEGKI